MRGLVLSLFPGIGMLDLAFEREGFCVVRGPDLLWGGDVRRFNPPADRFDGIIGGPPCQDHSALAHLNRAKGVESRHGDQNPEFDRVVSEARPSWFVRENAPQSAPASPLAYNVHSQLLEDSWVGGLTQRLRRICFGVHGSLKARPLNIDVLALSNPQPARAVTCDARQGSVGERVRLKDKGVTGGELNAGKVMPLEEMLRNQGLPADFFGEDSPFTHTAKRRMIGNGVPLAMGGAIAAAVGKAMQCQ